MHERRARRSQKANSLPLVEPLESRTLFSTSYATMVFDAPRSPALPVQVDRNASSPANSSSTLDSAVDIRVRVVAAGIYLTAAVSSTELMPEAPSGTVDFYDNLQFIGSAPLGGALRSTAVLASGQHTFYAIYSGDATFNVSQTALTTYLLNPTTTLPAAPADANLMATNNHGERVRPTRFLSMINFFDANSLSVAALPPIPGSDPGAGASFSLAPGDPIPTPRFSKITFSLKLPKLIGSH